MTANNINPEESQKNKKTGNVFDVYLRQIFSLVPVFVDFMKNYADPKVYAAIDWTTVKAFPTQSFDINNKELIADMIFTCSLHGDPVGKVSVIVLFELISKPVFYLPKRFLQYLVGAWNHHAGDESIQIYLPTPYFIAVRSGKGNKHKKQIYPKTSDMCVKVDGIEVVNGLNFKYNVVELFRYSLADLLGNPTLRTAFGVVKVLTENQYEKFNDALMPIKDCPDYDEKRFIIKISLELYAKVLRSKGKVFNVKLMDSSLNVILEDPKERENMKKTIFEKVFSEGEARGEARGKAKGIVEGEARGEVNGEVKGEAKAVITILQMRFNRVPKSINNRIFLIKNNTKLLSLLQVAAQCKSIKEFQLAING
ncbi:MAG: Rpn family recombination-promoting nuclease/putative transposase [Planctomycetaceae bacterium]|jgi:hypothetical protein|nr:Rpn family recombination-promoting nuclease/putative transposase [Planctomycetaceae bacterium]